MQVHIVANSDEEEGACSRSYKIPKHTSTPSAEYSDTVSIPWIQPLVWQIDMLAKRVHKRAALHCAGRITSDTHFASQDAVLPLANSEIRRHASDNMCAGVAEMYVSGEAMDVVCVNMTYAKRKMCNVCHFSACDVNI